MSEHIHLPDITASSAFSSATAPASDLSLASRELPLQTPSGWGPLHVTASLASIAFIHSASFTEHLLWACAQWEKHRALQYPLWPTALWASWRDTCSSQLICIAQVPTPSEFGIPPVSPVHLPQGCPKRRSCIMKTSYGRHLVKVCGTADGRGPTSSCSQGRLLLGGRLCAVKGR